jgi:predicted dehydrogenase
MGKRRIRNLLELKAGEIIGYDIRKDRREQAQNLYSIKTIDDFQSGLKMRPDAMIISTPPNLHLKYATIAAKNKIHFFTEVNTIQPDKIRSLTYLIKQNKVVGLPSSTLMFHPSVIKMNELVEKKQIGKPLLFNLHSGSYLPDWHPWEKLQDYYVYKKNTGGGRDEIAWELSWILKLMGKPRSVTAFTRKLSAYKAHIYDVYDLIVEFENKSIGHIMVDLIQRPIHRVCEIIGDSGTIRWEWEHNMIKLFSTKKERWLQYHEHDGYRKYNVEKPRKGFAISSNQGLNESYIEEMKNFIDVIKGKKEPVYTFDDERIHLKLMYAAEESSSRRVHIKM